jgi:hypothetical protein
MKISWIAAAGRYLPQTKGGALGRLFGLFDGSLDWRPISTAPFNRDVQVRIGNHGSRVLPFPCRQTAAGWINLDLGVRMELDPSEWRPWPE